MPLLLFPFLTGSLWWRMAMDPWGVMGSPR